MPVAFGVQILRSSLIIVSIISTIVLIYSHSFAQKELLPLIVNADYLEYDENKILASGRVKVKYKDILLTADNFQADLKKGDIQAESRVFLSQKKQEIEGEKLIYNLDKEEGVFYGAKTEIDKVFFRGEKIELSKDKTNITEGSFTTCNLPSPHYQIRAKRIIVEPNKKIVAKKISFWAGKTHLFSLPYLIMPLGEKKREGFKLPLSLSPGYDQEDKFYLQGGFSYSLATNHQARVRLYYPLKKKILAEGGLERITPSQRLSLIVGRRVVKDINKKNVQVGRFPELTLTGEPYLIPKTSLLVTSQLGGGKFKEDKTLKSNRIKLGLGIENKPLNFGSSSHLNLGAGYQKFWYGTKYQRHIITNSIGLEQRLNPEIKASLNYIRREQKGSSPFRFDQLDLLRELKGEIDIKFKKRWELDVLSRYNLKRDSFYETTFKLGLTLHCIETQLSWKAKEKRAEMGIGLVGW